MEFGRRLVRRDHDLLALVHQGVERVEELFLGRILVGDELHVVDHQDVERAELLREVHNVVLAQRPDEPVQESYNFV